MGTATKATDHLRRWRILWEEPVRGWDFSDVEGCFDQESPPWCYEELARHEMSVAGSALDLGTGGGEFLLSVQDALPVEMHATEGWAPNVPVARAALDPLGVQLREYDAERDDALPYRDECVDLVLARHEAYAAAEVARVLRPGGWFLTQQVEGHDLDDLAAVFGAGPAYPALTLATLRREATDAGLIVKRAEAWHGSITFADVDTIVSFLRFMPWLLPEDFSVERYADQLFALEQQRDPLVFTQRRLVLLARRPAPEAKAAPFLGW